MIRRQWQRWLAGAVGAALLLTAVRVWRADHADPPPEPVLRSQICGLGKQLRAFQVSERVRAWAYPGLASRQASWNAAKAQLILHQTKPTDSKTKPSKGLRGRLRASLKRLIVARSQSLYGVREMREEGGARVRAFWSRVDGTLQPYSLRLPHAYDSTVAWPLVVSLHGHGWFKPFQGHPAPNRQGVFSLSPHGRGATDYKELGEEAVLGAIEEVCLDYNIDRERIYVTGGSMGGTGSWQLGCSYADRFAGIMPIAGNADSQAWTERWGWNQSFEGRHDKLRAWLQETHSARAHARNLVNLPTYVVHGSGDGVVPPEHARRMVAALREAGAPVEYREFPGVGHGGFPAVLTREGLAWMCGRVRERYPKRVVWRSALLRTGKAYWVRFICLLKPCDFGEIEAEVTEANRVALRTHNLASIELELAPELFDLGRPLIVDADGNPLEIPAPGERRWVRLQRQADGTWSCPGEDEQADSGLTKRVGLEGPISEVLLGPFVVVVGTVGQDQLTRDLWMLEGREFAAEWKRRNNAFCPVIRDVDCTESMAQSRNLILLGGPTDNLVTASVAGGLPLSELEQEVLDRLPDDRLELRLTGLDEDPDVGLMMLYPNPLHPNRLVVVVSGNGPAAIYQGWKRFGNWFNWGVFDSKKYFDYAIFDARSVSPESFLCFGYFGTDWRLGTGAHYGGSADVRSRLGTQAFPWLAVVPEDQDEVYLADIRPKTVDHMRGALGLGRSYHGAPLLKSIGVRAPAFLEYEVGEAFERFSSVVQLRNGPDTALSVVRERSERVKFLIKGDGKPKGSAVVSWRKPIASIEADIEGVKMLRLEVTVIGGPGWLHSGAAWVLPSIRKPDAE